MPLAMLRCLAHRPRDTTREGGKQYPLDSEDETEGREEISHFAAGPTLATRHLLAGAGAEGGGTAAGACAACPAPLGSLKYRKKLELGDSTMRVVSDFSPVS